MGESDNNHEWLHADEKRRKRMKLIKYIIAFAVFQTLVIVLFALVVMKVKTPKFRVGALRVQTLAAAVQPSPSFNASFIAPIRIKNTNFGPYKYEATTVGFIYDGVIVGQVGIPKGTANFKSTKKIDVAVAVNSAALPDASRLGNELNYRVLTLNSVATMNGKVELMLIFKKKKTTTMDCTMIINLDPMMVSSIECK